MAHMIRETWEKIAIWLETRAPETLEHLQAPATQEQFDAVATIMKLELIDDFKNFYQIFNGTDPNKEAYGIFPSCDEWDDMAFGPLSLEQILQEWKMQKELLESGDFEGLEPQSADGIANDWWKVGWIPFADNGGGDYYCIDMNPTDTGTTGQVISHSHETGEHKMLARSLSAFLKDLANSLDSNAFEYDADYGVRRKEIGTE